MLTPILRHAMSNRAALGPHCAYSAAAQGANTRCFVREVFQGHVADPARLVVKYSGVELPSTQQLVTVFDSHGLVRFVSDASVTAAGMLWRIASFMAWPMA